LSPAEAEEVAAGLRDGTVKLLYVAPERFNNERFLTMLGRTDIALFAVDEVHCISEWGHNFRPDYLKIAEISGRVKAQRILGLTATATPAVVRDICDGFGIPPDCAVVTGFHRPNLTLSTVPLPAEARDHRLLRSLTGRPPGPTIVYTTLQKTAERVAETLSGAGLPARAYHAGLETGERSAVQEWWMGAEAGIVVATLAFGMGINKANVRYVYHYNLPKNLESYSQEIGRAGRDGEPALAEMFACADDLTPLENFAYGDTPTDAALRSLIDDLLSLDPGAESSLSLFELSSRHDIRPLVLRTALTYLELLGVLRELTPRYLAYELKLLRPPDEIAAALPPERARFFAALLAEGKKGRTWYRFLPDEIAGRLGQSRARVVRALEELPERGWGELRPSEVRHRYRRLRLHEDARQLAAELAGRFQGREQREIARLQEVLAFVAHEGCQANALAAHFGEVRGQPCGHCTFCLHGRQRLEPPRPLRPLPGSLDLVELRLLRRQHGACLAAGRPLARWLCGITSPAVSRARLTGHPLFGALEAYRFADVLRWCETAAF
jgi:ATP-dependent DNA helicase RecQ